MRRFHQNATKAPSSAATTASASTAAPLIDGCDPSASEPGWSARRAGSVEANVLPPCACTLPGYLHHLDTRAVRRVLRLAVASRARASSSVNGSGLHRPALRVCLGRRARRRPMVLSIGAGMRQCDRGGPMALAGADAAGASSPRRQGRPEMRQQSMPSRGTPPPSAPCESSSRIRRSIWPKAGSSVLGRST